MVCALPVSPALQAAYAATTYGVDGRPDWALRIGAACAALSRELVARGLTAAAYVTAWNPAGRRAQAAANVSAQARLVARVAAMGLTAYPGWGRGDAADWPPERSLLILGAGRRAAQDLARDFGQRACVVLEAGGTAEIVLVVPGSSPWPPACLDAQPCASGGDAPSAPVPDRRASGLWSG